MGSNPTPSAVTDMARAALTASEQMTVLKAVQQQLAINQGQLAARCRVHPRTFSDWMRGRVRMRYDILEALIQDSGITVAPIGQLPEFGHVRAAARLGALRRNTLYGNPGTPDGRRRGGVAAMMRMRAAQMPGMEHGFVFAKRIREPAPSSELAEFIGMMLGDGCLCSAFQAALYFNTETDRPYADYMDALAVSLFGIKPHHATIAGTRAGALVFSSKRLVDYLLSLGLKRGDKVTHQAGVPAWITANVGYRRSCLRGLMDTDGSVYAYQHLVAGKRYGHVAWCFTNRSLPLLHFARDTLRLNGYRPTTSQFRVYLHRRSDIARYFSDIDTHNLKHRQRYTLFSRTLEASGRGTQVVDGAALEKR